MTVKTAISLDDSLMEQVKEIASETGYTRSGLFSLAMRGFIERYENKKIQDAINAVYSIPLTEAEAEEEAILRRQHRAYHRKLIEGTW